MPLHSQENFRKLLDHIADGRSMPKATALACGTRSKIAWVWMRNARNDREAGIPMEDSAYCIKDWPEIGEDHWLDEARIMALQIAKLDLEGEVLDEIRHSRKYIVEGGRIQYEIAHDLVAKYGGDVDVANLCGEFDPFYKHDANGARIPLTVRADVPAQLKIAALKATNPRTWNVEQKVTVNKKPSPVLTIGERKRPGATPLVEDLRSRLDNLRKNGAQHPKPSHPVAIARADPSDPPERVSRVEEPTHNPDPRPSSFERRLTNALDAQDRGGGMPSGGFSATTGRPT